MKMKVDIGIASLCKKGEEVCGDTTKIIEEKDSTTVILSDGLGSGIKASILSILSTQIASRMLEKNIRLEEVFTTIADTLPICKVRGIAYSTLSILKVKIDGSAHLIEYDNPSLMLIRDNDIVSIKKIKRNIAGKEVYESFFQLELNDLLFLISDGVINAGVGGLFELGLGRDRLLDNIFKRNLTEQAADKVAKKIIGLTEACYMGKAGDDSTALVIKSRRPRSAVVLTGPPQKKRYDSQLVAKFLDYTNAQKIVCGGATGNMVARELGFEIETSLDYIDPSVPPVADIEGIDLVTEGILTLNKTVDKIKQLSEDNFNDNKNEFDGIKDGASILSKSLLKADEITFLMGSAVNPAHEELMKSLQLKPRPVIIGKLVNLLRKHGKEVNIERY
ncbi:SpoIIE family protein phosphatase [Iocasia frigidifontis]|uniref:SpoIIE family protein phosphatase n=2 Tax=Iocasia fonsfrigidae TaxID=2682810 RepID=A0A8A7KC95_9FIRM|nr:SpoIIE family protein phosphatase [Iocasia fonsfrigidae]